ncbi:MAG: SDR family oxidoreductase [Pseudomonadota bacterium]
MDTFVSSQTGTGPQTGEMKMTNTLTRRAALTALAGTAAIGAAATGAMAASTDGKPLSGKTALVTGARNNIGRAFAVTLAGLGANVLVHYHRPESRAEADETAAMVRAAGANAALFIGDLGDGAVAGRMYDRAEEVFGGVDIAVHAAGRIIKKPMADFTEAEFDRLVNDNVGTTFYAMREAARRLRPGGRVINVGTSLTAGTAPQYAVYAGTKAPVEEFTRILAREVGDRGITVNTIAPGPIDTPFFHGQETPQSAAFAAGLSVEGRLGTEDDLAPLLAFLARPESQWVNGQTLFVNGGYLTR